MRNAIKIQGHQDTKVHLYSKPRPRSRDKSTKAKNRNLHKQKIIQWRHK